MGLCCISSDSPFVGLLHVFAPIPVGAARMAASLGIFPGPPSRPSSETVGQSSPLQQHCHCLWPPEVTPGPLLACTVHPCVSVQSHSCHHALALCIRCIPENCIHDTLPAGGSGMWLEHFLSRGISGDSLGRGSCHSLLSKVAPKLGGSSASIPGIRWVLTLEGGGAWVSLVCCWGKARLALPSTCFLGCPET